MTTDTDIWLAFARTFGMLFVVLALFLLAFYLFRRFSGVSGAKGTKDLIQVLAVHHVSPKEKLILVNVLDENILIGVTPQSISSLAVLGEKKTSVLPQTREPRPGFSDLLKKTLKNPADAIRAGKTQDAGSGETIPTRGRE